jgi:hypothetical protein
MGAKGKQGEVVDAETLGWLTDVPASDVNFKGALARADAATIRAALKKIEGQPATATKKKALEAALRRLEDRPAPDPVSEAADQVVEVEQQRTDLALSEQEERERRIAECHEVIGRIQGFKLITEFADVGNLVWLRQVKESKLYRDLPDIGTWDKFCDRVGLSRSKVDEDLANLAAFGERFLADVGNFSLGYRDLRKLRQLSHDGAVVIDAEAVVIGEERIPLDADHKEDLQAAIETLIEQQAAMQNEVEAQKKAFDRVQADTRKSMTKLQKDLDKFTQQAEAKGLTPEEDAYLQKCENARITIDGFLNQFDPQYNPLPEDATPKMRAAHMQTLAWFRRCIRAAYDTAADLYGDPEMDGGWVPPSRRVTDAVEDVPVPKGCQLCRSAHPTCVGCCKDCTDKCNGAQACRLEA